MKMILHAQEIEGVLHRIRLSEPTIHADNEANGRVNSMLLNIETVR